MRARAVIVVGISPEHAAQMRLAENEQMVQTFSSDRSDQSLDVSVLPRRPRGYGAIPDAHCPDPSLEYLSVDAVAVSDEVFGRRVPRKGLRDLAGDPIASSEVYKFMKGRRLLAIIRIRHTQVVRRPANLERRTRCDPLLAVSIFFLATPVETAICTDTFAQWSSDTAHRNKSALTS